MSLSGYKNYFAKSLVAKGIQTPTTPKEFRQNLKKYFVVITDEKTGEDYLYLRGQDIRAVPLSSLNSMPELYQLLGGAFVEIAPLCEQTKDVGEFMDETDQMFSCAGYFQDPNNFVLRDSLDDMESPFWVSLDNRIWREYYGLTLGEFCGYAWEREAA